MQILNEPLLEPLTLRSLRPPELFCGATIAVGASVADWAMQEEPWCVEAAREIRELSQEVLDFAEDRYARTAALVSVGA